MKKRGAFFLAFQGFLQPEISHIAKMYPEFVEKLQKIRKFRRISLFTGRKLWYNERVYCGKVFFERSDSFG